MNHDALKRFVKATEQFEARFAKAEMGMSGPRTQNGATYVEHLNGISGPVFIGDSREAFPSPDAVIEATFSRLGETYPSSPDATLYWRIKPEIAYSDHHKGWVTYCRFVISNPERTDG